MAPRGPWPRRLGLIVGGITGCLLAFGIAALAERMALGDPEWILRLGSPLLVILGAVVGVRATRGIGSRGYRVLGVLTGVAVAGILGLLVVALFGLGR